MLPRNQKDIKFHDKSKDFENVKSDILMRKQSMKKVQKNYKNGMVDVIIF